VSLTCDDAEARFHWNVAPPLNVNVVAWQLMVGTPLMVRLYGAACAPEHTATKPAARKVRQQRRSRLLTI